jgi:hypothetical protein
MKIEQQVRAAAKKDDCKISLMFRADSPTGGCEMELNEKDLIKLVEVLKIMKSNG